MHFETSKYWKYITSPTRVCKKETRVANWHKIHPSWTINQVSMWHTCKPKKLVNMPKTPPLKAYYKVRSRRHRHNRGILRHQMIPGVHKMLSNTCKQPVVRKAIFGLYLQIMTFWQKSFGASNIYWYHWHTDVFIFLTNWQVYETTMFEMLIRCRTNVYSRDFVKIF